jgi:hypothetical protein
MAKQSQPNNGSLKKLGIAGGVLLLIAVFFPGGSEPIKKGGKGNFQFAGGGSSGKKKTDLFEKEDYTAKFASIDSEMKNAFQPLVAKKDNEKNQKPLAVNAIPANFASGDGNWIYTGNMTVDGVPNALLENTQSNEGVFLRPGEKWKSMQLKEVRSDSIVLEGPNGYTKTVFFATNPEVKPVEPGRVAANSTAPGQPAVGAATNAQTLPPADANQGGGRRRRRDQQQSTQASADLFGPIGGNVSELENNSLQNSFNNNREN